MYKKIKRLFLKILTIVKALNHIVFFIAYIIINNYFKFDNSKNTNMIIRFYKQFHFYDARYKVCLNSTSISCGIANKLLFIIYFMR